MVFDKDTGSGFLNYRTCGKWCIASFLEKTLLPPFSVIFNLKHCSNETTLGIKLQKII